MKRMSCRNVCVVLLAAATAMIGVVSATPYPNMECKNLPPGDGNRLNPCNLTGCVSAYGYCPNGNIYHAVELTQKAYDQCVSHNDYQCTESGTGQECNRIDRYENSTCLGDACSSSPLTAKWCQ